MSIMAVENLTRRYGSRIGVERLSLIVEEGTLLGFLGPNGAGKTTTIRVLMGLLKPSQGKATVFGMDCWRDSHRIKADVGYLPGDLRLYPWLTYRDAIRIFGRARGRDLTATGWKLVEMFDLEPDVRVRSMSRGMRQMLGLILALAHRPKLLVLDEPTAGLDPLMQEKLCHHLRGLADAGHCIFFSSHTLSEVERLCDRVAILRRGILVADETLHDLRARAKRLVTIQWHPDAKPNEIKPPESLHVVQRRRRQWRATLAGSAVELVRWSATQPIEDLSISPPDLASLFQEYYPDAEASS